MKLINETEGPRLPRRGPFLMTEVELEASGGGSKVASWVVAGAVLDGVHVGLAVAVGETGINSSAGEKSAAGN